MNGSGDDYTATRCGIDEEHEKQDRGNESLGGLRWRGSSPVHTGKLLPRFAHKVNGRYDFDQSELVQRVRAYLDRLEKDREIRAAALELLRSRRVSNEAAHKWLQRHPPEEAIKARPRHRSPSSRQ
jgi:hypothetical protein